MAGDSAPEAEARFREVFVHLPEVVAYARRRGSRDPEAVGAEALTIAWRKLADVPADDARPWLFATARNLLRAEWRKASAADGRGGIPELARDTEPEVQILDPELARGADYEELFRAIVATEGDPRLARRRLPRVTGMRLVLAALIVLLILAGTATATYFVLRTRTSNAITFPKGGSIVSVVGSAAA